MSLIDNARSLASHLRSRVAGNARSAHLDALPAEDADFSAIWNECRPYTMTSFARGLALFRSVRYLVENDIRGDIVECGVWRGGSCMIAMATLRLFGAMNRRVLLFDTFQGMTEPGAEDVDLMGTSAEAIFGAHAYTPDNPLCRAGLDEVKSNIATIGYPGDLVEFIPGDVRQTVRAFRPRPISLLRLRERGVLIIDDYGHWQGARRAVDEYMATLRAAGRAPMLNIIDYTGRLAVKVGRCPTLDSRGSRTAT
jgi:hypothetical protein